MVDLLLPHNNKENLISTMGNPLQINLWILKSDFLYFAAQIIQKHIILISNNQETIDFPIPTALNASDN